MNMVLSILQRVINVTITTLNGASVWLVASFIIAGLLHNILTPEKLQKMLGNKKISSLVKATVSGMFLPICSCGVIPLGLGLYHSGAYLGPFMAFVTATPIINPAAVILAFGLLGPQVAGIYLASGFLIPMIVGILGNMLGGPELHVPGSEESFNVVCLEDGTEMSLKQKLLTGLEWGITDLGLQVSKFVVPAMFVVGFILVLVPHSFIEQYLGAPGLISISGIALLAMLMYVCAVGHIPFVAALVAAGASPGTALTFLTAGAATNLPELISIYKMIGKRAAVIYGTGLFTCALLVGYLTNYLLMPGFKPVFDLSRSQQAISMANNFIFSPPLVLRYAATLIIFVMCFYAYWPKVQQNFQHIWVRNEEA